MGAVPTSPFSAGICQAGTCAGSVYAAKGSCHISRVVSDAYTLLRQGPLIKPRACPYS